RSARSRYVCAVSTSARQLRSTTSIVCFGRDPLEGARRPPEGDRGCGSFDSGDGFSLLIYVQSAGSITALIAGSALAFSCCAVITIATEPIISAAAIRTRIVMVSPAKAAPNNTATIGFTYA